MGRNAIGHHGVLHLFALLKIGCVKDLDLSGKNRLSLQGIAEQLKNNTTLRRLGLWDCGLTSLSAKSLAEALTTNKHLETVNISCNALCDDGIQYLADSLRGNKGLKYLYLVNCGMTDVGFECLINCIQENNVLTELAVWNYRHEANPNRITNKIVKAMTKYLQKNFTLTKLVLPKSCKHTVLQLQRAVNDVRRKCEFPLVNVSGRSPNA